MFNNEEILQIICIKYYTTIEMMFTKNNIVKYHWSDVYKNYSKALYKCRYIHIHEQEESLNKYTKMFAVFISGW